MEACHSAQQSNLTAYGATAVAIITLEAFAGMWINAFIVSVLCIGWLKKKTLNSNEKILLLLGCSRICFLCSSWVYYFLSIFFPNYLDIGSIFQLLSSFKSCFNASNLWVAACLCGFYCIKIANFSNSFFIYLKVKIDRMVPWLLLGSGIFALATGIVIYDFIEAVLTNNLNFSRHGNMWEAGIEMDNHFYSYMFLNGFEYAVTFIAVIFSAVFLLFSLWRHKRKMQTNSMMDLSVDAHIRAMKSILSFLVMYSINFLCVILSTFSSVKKENTTGLLIDIYLCAFPGGHSLILIFSNPKLEKALLNILSWVKCELFMKQEL